MIFHGFEKRPVLVCVATHADEILAEHQHVADVINANMRLLCADNMTDRICYFVINATSEAEVNKVINAAAAHVIARIDCHGVIDLELARCYKPSFKLQLYKDPDIARDPDGGRTYGCVCG